MIPLWLLAIAHIGPEAQSGAGTRCQTAVARQLRDWGVVAPATAQPPLTPGATLRHWPTSSLGVWVVEDTSTSRAVVIRVAPDVLSRLEWSPTCAPVVTTRVRERAPAPRFGDRELTALLATSGRGVIYLWSPHMPLSVDGYAQLTAAARQRGLAVQAVLDPQADREFAASAAADGGLPASALRVADSVELQFREVSLHAPAIAVHADGRLVGPVLRGYRTAAEYGAFLDRVLAPAKAH